jgi:hypothetical protein
MGPTVHRRRLWYELKLPGAHSRDGNQAERSNAMICSQPMNVSKGSGLAGKEGKEREGGEEGKKVAKERGSGEVFECEATGKSRCSWH